MFKGSNAFNDHEAAARFLTEEFRKEYPLAENSYLEDPYSVIAVSLNQKNLTLEIGETYQLEAQIEPSTAKNKNGIWSTLGGCATVSDSGLVKALHTGRTSVTAVTQDGNKYDVCYIEVIDSLATYFGFVDDAETGQAFWYEENTRQGVTGDPKNIWDTLYGVERGREIFDPASDA